jgi:hypothetical protein
LEFIAGCNHFRHPLQRYAATLCKVMPPPVQHDAATELIAEQRCQKYHPRRRRVRENRTCSNPRFSHFSPRAKLSPIESRLRADRQTCARLFQKVDRWRSCNHLKIGGRN